jgi:hypothetical protein
MNFIEESEKSGEVDLAIIEPLETLLAEFEQMENHWLETYADDNIEASFPMFHVSRNGALILGQMIQRYKTAKETKDNPRVAEDTFTVLPSLIDSITLMMEAKDGPSSLFGDQSFQTARVLRNMARHANMLPDDENDILSIPQKTRKKGFKVFQDTVMGLVSEN